MKENEFDSLWVKRWEEEQIHPPKDGWEKLSEALPSPLAKRIFPLLRYASVAASLLLLAGISVLLFQPDPLSPGSRHTAVLKQSISPVEASATVLTEPAETAPEPYLSTDRTASPVQANADTRSNLPLAYTAPGQQTGEDKLWPEPVGTDLPVNPEPVHNNEDIAIGKTQPNKLVPQSEPARKDTDPLNQDDLYDRSKTYSFDLLQSDPGYTKFQLELTGGVNYGNMNEGYMAGVIMQHQISSRLNFNGGVSIIRNQAQHAIKLPLAKITAFENQSIVSRPVSHAVTEMNLRFFYLHLNPGLNYKLHEKVQVGIGADIQHLLERNDQITFMITENNQSRTLPVTDLGWSSHIDFQIHEKITTSIAYRDGLNHWLIQGDNLWNKKYLQVQIKYKIFKSRD